MLLLIKKLNIFTIIMMVIAINCTAQTDTTQHRIKGRSNSAEQQQKPYVIMISLDGFRYDYADKHQAENLLRLSGQGVRAASMMPSFPSLTFPNHYTLATGLYPSHHGLVGNSFYDPAKKSKYSMSDKAKVADSSWYGGTPLWVLAEQQQMMAASLFWVGSEAAVKGIRASYYYNYTEDISIPKRVQIVKDWLSLPAAQRPHLIMFYLSEPDHSGHTYGPDAPQTRDAVKMADSVVNALSEMAKTTGLPVNFVVVSDHGMTEVDRQHPLALPAAIDPEKFIVPTVGTMVDIHAKNAADIQPLYDELKKNEKDYKVYLKANIPDYLHYSSKDDSMNRIADILIIPEWPKVFSNRIPGMGYHGFDPYKVKNMEASFFAWGPAFKSGLKIPTFQNVNVYPMVAEILGLTITEKIDGKKEVLQNTLK